MARLQQMIMRKALADWGDYILDALAKKYAHEKKIVEDIEDARRELIDPLR